jgi:hypothetical protein
MKDEILLNLDNPRQLEKLYRADKPTFKRAFKALYPEVKDNALVNFWNERLSFTSEEISWGTNSDLVFVIIASLVAGLIAKLPALLGINEEFFYQRNIGFVVFPALSAYFAWKNRLSAGKIALVAAATLAGSVFINSLPDVKESDTLILSCIHLVLFLWGILAFTFVGDKRNDVEKRLGYLRYNGDLLVMAGLILISGFIMTAVTINLFDLIGFKIEELYFQYFGIFALSAVPIVATYLTQTNPQLVGKVSPVIARIFSPLVLVMLVIYLVAMVYSGKDPYNDRDFLLLFNALLVAVMAIIFFSVAETSKTSNNRIEIWVLLLLSAVTIIVNGIALSAILFRISEWGITPNRAAVLGSNALILINLLLVAGQLFKVLFHKGNIAGVGKAIAYYLPIYFIWTIIVTFVFPFLFGFK